MYCGKYQKKICISLLFGLFTACCSSPRAQIIDFPSTALEKAAQNAGEEQFARGETLPQHWWELFNDPQLTWCIETAIAMNPSLDIARTKILAAATRADSSRSSLFPYLEWGGDVLREKLSQTGLIPFNLNNTNVPIAATGGLNGIPVYFTQYETQVSLSYDFDVWDKNRNTWKAALGDVQANIADAAFVNLQLSTAVAKVYYQLQIAYKRREVVEQLVASRERYIKLVEKRIKQNIDNIITLEVAQINLSQAQQSILRVENDIIIAENQLKAYLAGDFEEEIASIDLSSVPLPRIPLPENLPLHLLAHRPDIMTQLWLIESAGKRIEVAKAGFYPDFNLTGLVGFQTLHLHKLFFGKSSYFFADPAFSLPIFDGGRLLANLRGSEVDYDQAIFQYNQLVINAAQDVLQGIGILKNTEAQLKESEKMAELQAKLYQLSILRTKNNLTSGLDELTNKGNVYTAQDQAIVSLGTKIQAMIALIKALGGGFNTCEETEES